MNLLKKIALYSALIGSLAFGGNALAQESGLEEKLQSKPQVISIESSLLVASDINKTDGTGTHPVGEWDIHNENIVYSSNGVMSHFNAKTGQRTKLPDLEGEFIGVYEDKVVMCNIISYMNKIPDDVFEFYDPDINPDILKRLYADKRLYTFNLGTGEQKTIEEGRINYPQLFGHKLLIRGSGKDYVLDLESGEKSDGKPFSCFGRMDYNGRFDHDVLSLPNENNTTDVHRVVLKPNDSHAELSGNFIAYSVGNKLYFVQRK